MLWKLPLGLKIHPLQICQYKGSCSLWLHILQHLNPIHPVYMQKKWCRKIDAKRPWHGGVPPPINPTLRLHSCALFVDNFFADRGPQPRKQRPYVGDPEKHRASRPRILSSLNSHIPERFTSYLLGDDDDDDDDDDVVDMMMWLT